MANKATWLFKGAIGIPAVNYGYSESWYTNATDAALITKMDAVSAVRRQVLPKFSAIIGYRVQEATGRAYVIRKQFLGLNSNGPQNVQVDAALMQCRVEGSATIKKFFLHDLPDSYSDDGVVSPANIRKLTDVVSLLTIEGFQVRYRQQTAPQATIVSVTSLGVVTTLQPIVLAANDEVQFLRTRDTNGRTIRGRYAVETVASPTQFTLRGWPNNITVGFSGKVRKLVYAFGNCLVFEGDGSFIRPGGKKVGRPFFSFRGRAPARR